MVNSEDQNKDLELEEKVFLAVDSPSFASYTTNKFSPATSFVLPGDFAGFVLAVDADFDPKEGTSRPDESPGFVGQMRILGSLIWSDLYPLIASQSSLLEDIWPSTIDHPNQVYVGPTIPMQVYIWRNQNAMRWILLREVVEYAKRRMGISTTSTSGTASTSAPASTNPLATADAASPPPPPQQQQQQQQPQSESLSSDPSQPPLSSSAIPPLPADLLPSHGDIRSYMLGEFRRHLRRNNQSREAVMVEELMALQPNETPDGARMRQRLEENDRRREQRRRDGLDSDEEEEEDMDEQMPQCPSQ